MNIKNETLKLISQTLYRAYSLPYKRKGGTDATYEQTAEEKDKLRKISFVIDRLIATRIMKGELIKNKNKPQCDNCGTVLNDQNTYPSVFHQICNNCVKFESTPYR